MLILFFFTFHFFGHKEFLLLRECQLRASKKEFWKGNDAIIHCRMEVLLPSVLSGFRYGRSITVAAVRRSPGGTQEWDKMDAMFIEYLLCERVLLSNGYSCEQDRPQSLPYCCPHPSVGRQAVKTWWNKVISEVEKGFKDSKTVWSIPNSVYESARLRVILEVQMGVTDSTSIAGALTTKLKFAPVPVDGKIEPAMWA